MRCVETGTSTGRATFLDCQKAYILTGGTEHEKHASKVSQNIGVHFWGVSFSFDTFWVSVGNEELPTTVPS